MYSVFECSQPLSSQMLTSILNPFHAAKRSLFFSSSSTRSTTALTTLAVPSRFRSRMFQIVKIKSRAADSDARYERTAALTAAAAAAGLDARALRRVINAACFLQRESARGLTSFSSRLTLQAQVQHRVKVTVSGWAVGWYLELPRQAYWLLRP